MEEMETELTFASFARNIDTQMADSKKSALLKEEERKLNKEISDTTRQYKEL